MVNPADPMTTINIFTTGGPIDKGCIAMNGRIFDPQKVQENLALDRFEEALPDRDPMFPRSIAGRLEAGS